MNWEQLREGLVKAGRDGATSDEVPSGFSGRVLARLRGNVGVSPLVLWNRVLWQAVAPGIAVMALAAVWTCLAEPRSPSPDSLAAELEQAVCAPLHAPEEVW